MSRDTSVDKRLDLKIDDRDCGTFESRSKICLLYPKRPDRLCPHPAPMKTGVLLVWSGLFVHPFSPICNTGHVNYRLQFTTHLVTYRHLHNTI